MEEEVKVQEEVVVETPVEEVIEDCESEECPTEEPAVDAVL